ncbi:MAG: hypothetical protein GX329_04725 [Tissierellia bacterium]|nr:hypothetical protein [Tissierellia bacterium]
MSFFTRRDQLIILALVLIIGIISMFRFFNRRNIDADNILSNMETNMDIEPDEEEEREEGPIMIHISGQVNNPGLVELEMGARVIDAVNLAGGLKREADLDRMNLAKKLIDEEKIYIPAIGEEEIPIAAETLMGSQGLEASNPKININIATKEELMTLPGIGEVTAGKILDYREGSPFKIIDDIKNVSGIGEKKFEAIMELITVR